MRNENGMQLREEKDPKKRVDFREQKLLPKKKKKKERI